MASLYRFGFEGGYLPDGVFVTGSYAVVRGRSGESSSAISSIDPVEARLVMSSQEASNEIYITEHVRFNTYGIGSPVTLLSYGPVDIEYVMSESVFTCKLNGVGVWNSPKIAIPTSTYIPLAYHIKLAQSGSVEIVVSDITCTYNLSNPSPSYPTNIQLGMGSVDYIRPQLSIDDIAVNNGISRYNSTGSYGLSDSGFPKYVRGLRSLIRSTGSSFEWRLGDSYSSANITDVINGNAVGNFQNLVQLMRNDNNGFAILTHIAEHVEKLLRLLRCQNSGGLIQNQDLSSAVQHLDDFDGLFL